MLRQKILTLQGLPEGVSVSVDDGFFAALPKVFANWPYEVSDPDGRACFADVTLEGGTYRVSSPHMAKDEVHKDPVNTLCTLIVELAWAHLRAEPDLLCLHGAAVQIGGRLVVFPSTRRAGKSTLSVAMMAAGLPVFTDDFLPLRIVENRDLCGLSHGISPRLRLPLPAQAGHGTAHFVAARDGLENRQYRYVTPRGGEMPGFGKTAPIGGLVFLRHEPGAAARLEALAPADVLKSLIKQNFSRAMNAAGILCTLEALARQAPAYTLVYDDIGAAIDLLTVEFSEFDRDAVRVKTAPSVIFAEAPAPTHSNPMDHGDWLQQAQGAMVVEIGLDHFITTPSGREIVHLNGAAATIWKLLSEPASPGDLVDMMASLYPEIDRAQIVADVDNTLASFAHNRLTESGSAVDFDANNLEHRPQGEVSL